MSPRVATLDVLMQHQQLSIEDLSEKTGLPLKRTEAIALGRWTPSPNERKVIAQVLAVDIDSISWGHTLDPRNVRYRQFGLQEEI